MANSTKPRAASPLHTEHIHVERTKPTWLWLLVPLLAIGLLALIYEASQPPQALVPASARQVVAKTIPVTPREVTYRNRQWQLKGTTETFLPGEIQLIGKSAQGDALYFNPKKGYTSGEGSKFIDNTLSTPSGRVYLKTPDGRYQPLFLKP